MDALGVEVGKAWTLESDHEWDKKHGIKEGSPQDEKLDAERGIKDAATKAKERKERAKKAADEVRKAVTPFADLVREGEQGYQVASKGPKAHRAIATGVKRLKTPALAGAGAAGLGAATAGGYKLGSRNSGIAKADKNITYHQVASAQARRTRNDAASLAGLGVAGVAATQGKRGLNYGRAGRNAVAAGKNVKLRTGRFVRGDSPIGAKTAVQRTATDIGRTARALTRDAHVGRGLAEGAVLGGTAVAAGAELANRHHRRQEQTLRRARLSGQREKRAANGEFSKSAHEAFLGDVTKRNVSDKQRDKLARKGDALPSGAFPIANAHDLKNAKLALGRAKPSERAKVRALIERRAKKLGEPGLGESKES